MEIKKVNDLEFKKYGQVLKNYNCEEIIEKMQKMPLPLDVIYEPSVKDLEESEIFKELMEREFGGLPIQIGYCNGNNNMLNAVEYHRSSEINIAVTDLILLLGWQPDINEDHTYDTSKIEAFLVPAGTIIEVFATTLHYAPCNADNNGFRCVVVLPKDTNMPLEYNVKKNGEDALLFAKNKWLIGHKDTDLGKQGAFIGLYGDNISLK
ncbi:MULTISPECIES: DUF4867 family protein [Clostridium]|uniref:DUF4867 domain-containing protein n=1 Tax=Clostridium butyricum E4 str. BoNT E BL5262 TaxID=632245 RepID=C4IC48_CLOBU|nr:MULTISPECIES: DUF4867 family protein [Clostridium]ETI87632.1 MAG: hypothetical protein Q607_CBUC00216G0153 [Clostridium butyricum DORA_1]EDT73765.1 conserved hypothetical protein [Clostridium butyricum 5521]EEP56356.1 conserved hypothetical protein [Clostridium butyricum E4 str. BoNT E BL5262]KJZ84174.1 hypothetical protein ClosIBUN125C_CONTIG67g03676 [Clostridium sp. IBUN125C]KJZ94101.1 Glycosyltransferase [Clostridium sp. IBUN13A]